MRGLTKNLPILHELGYPSTSEDPILGSYQTSHHFNNVMFDKFRTMAPIGTNPKQYEGRGIRQTRGKRDAISDDCQKFRVSFRFIRACNPAGVTDDQILSMAISKHLGKRDIISYDARYFPRER